MKTWENHQIDGINRMPARAHFLTFPSKEKALLNNNRYTHAFKNLNGVWKFMFLDAPEYSPEGFFNSDFDVTKMDDITVPGNWQLQGYGKMHYSDLWYNFPINPPYVPTENPTGIYKRTFFVEESYRDKKIIIRFCGVDSAYHLWINGKEVGYSKVARNESEFDITDLIRVGEENDVTVRVYQWSDGTYLEDQDMWWESGIFRDVELIGVPKDGINDYKVIADLDDEYKNRDNRMNNQLMVPGQTYWGTNGGRIDWSGDAAEIANASHRNFMPQTGTGYFPHKWCSERDGVPTGMEAYDFPVIRYAEVLLNYAEAVFERDGQISDEDLAISLNLTRKRINPEMPDLTNDFVTANNLDMRTEIRRERTIEFFDENFRIDDLKRWKTAEDEMPMNLTGVKWKDTDFESRWPDASFKDKDGEGCIIHEVLISPLAVSGMI